MTVERDFAPQAAGHDKLLGHHGVRTVAMVAVVSGLVAGGAATAFAGHSRSPLTRLFVP